MRTGAQRAAGWWEAAEGIHGTRLGAAARNLMDRQQEHFHEGPAGNTGDMREIF